MKKLFYAVFSLFLIVAALCGCVAAEPVSTPGIEEPAQPTPVAALSTERPEPLQPADLTQDDDIGFESAAEPLSESDFIVRLAEGGFNLLTQGAGELEALAGVKFSKSNELQTDSLLFTKEKTYIESVHFLNAPTDRGVKLGDSLQALLDAYGTPSETSDFGDYTSYVFYLRHDDTEGSTDFSSQRPLWFYAIGFTVSDGKVDEAFIADWSAE